MTWICPIFWSKNDLELRTRLPNNDKQPQTKKPGKAAQIPIELIQKHVDKENFSNDGFAHEIQNEYLKYS